jgi:putative ABC transport system permease protein
MAVATIIALVSLSQGVERSWSQGLADRGVHLVGFQKSAVEILSSSLNAKLIDEVSRVPGVKAAARELINLVRLPFGLVGVSGWSAGSFLWQTIRLREGRIPHFNNPREVVLGYRLAQQLKIKPSDRIPFEGVELEVVGLSRETLVLNENNLVLSLSQLQRIMNRENQITLINLQLVHPGDSGQVEALKDRLDRLFPEVIFLETREAIDASQILQTFRKMTLSVSGSAFLMGFFFILNTMLMSITERTQEMGILSAVGWSQARIMSLVVLEGTILTAIGTIVGLFFGTVGLQGLKNLRQFQSFFEPVFSMALISEVFITAIFLGAVGSLYPAWKTGRLRTLAALTHE